MTHPLFHAQSSVRRFGGKVEDYQPIHDWLDGTKEMFADFRHRALRHHSHGVFEAERLFGASIRNSSGTLVPTRYIAERHIKEDCRSEEHTSELQSLRHLVCRLLLEKK